MLTAYSKYQKIPGKIISFADDTVIMNKSNNEIILYANVNKCV